MSTWPSLGLLLLATLLLQVSLAEDLYWEGEEDASNEFLEVKEDNSIVGHLKRFKRQWNEDPPSPENEVNTEDPINNDDLDDEGTEGSGSAPETPRIESDNRVETENSGEKTLRVTFVVVQPYEEKYSNRDSPQFQQFSKTLAQAVNVLFDNLPGTQKASLIRIQSRPTDNFSCKVTLDIVTIGYDDTARIKQTLKEHISTYQYLGDVAVKDEDFSANEVNPGSAIETCTADQIPCDDGACIFRGNRCDGIQHCSDNSDELGCGVDERIVTSQQQNTVESNPEPECSERIPCASSSVTICRNQICDGKPDCPLGDDEKNCRVPPQGPERGDQSLFTTPPVSDIYQEVPETTPYYPPAQTCRPGEFRCDENRCILQSSVCDGRNDCFDGTDELSATCPETCGKGDFICENKRCIEGWRQCNHVSDCPNGEDERDCPCRDEEFRCVADGVCIEGRKRCDGVSHCRDGSDELNCGETRCPEGSFTCGSGSVQCATQCDGRSECENGEDELECGGCSQRCDGRCLEDSKICDNHQDCSDGSDEQECDLCDGPNDFRCKSNNDCIDARLRCNGISECADGSDEHNCNETMIASNEGCLESQFRCRDGQCINADFSCDNHDDCYDGSDEENCPCKYNEYPCVSGGCIPEYLKCNEQEDCPDGSDEINCESIPLVPSLTTEYSPGTSTEAYVPGRRDGQPSLPDYNGVRPTYSPFSPGSGSGSNNNIPPYETPSTTRSPPYYPPEDPNAGRAPSTYSPIPGGNGQDPNGVGGGGFGQGGQPDYPGGSGGPNGWGGSGQRGPNYPGGNSGQNGWGDSGQGGPNYPGGNGGQNGGDGSGQGRPINYPGGNGGQNGWGDFGQGGPINYPGGNGGQSGGGGSGQGRPINYPGGNGGQNGWGDSGQGGPINYPGGNGGQSGGGGSGQGGPINYPSGNGGQNGGGGSGEGVQPIYPGGSGDANGDGSYYQGRYPSSNDGGQSSSGSQIGGGSARGPVVLNVTTHPNQQTVRYGGDVVFRCRDEGPLRAPVRWVREFGRSLKPGAKDRKGRLELEKVTAADAGVYICQTPNYLGRPGSEVRVVLTVQNDRTTTLSPGQCKPYEATCANFECIPKSAVCDGHYDCSDKSDEDMCTTSGRCEPNQFQCDNNKCVLKTWLCDSENDCGDGSDERSCGAAQPGQPCLPSEFSCADGTQCVPKGFHCDGNSDCFDKSDEIGCAPVYIVKPPTPSNLRLNTGDTLTLQAEALGNPIPVISWRLNWGHVPPQCTSTSNNGVGILTCPNMQPEHSGAYSAEALNNKGTTFANPDAIVFVTQTSPCPPGYFNSEARSERECIKCFCFGESKQCRSADLFTYNMPTPLGQGGTRLQGVTITPSGEIRTDASISNHYYYQALRNGATVTKLASYDGISLGSFHPYLSLPETYNGQQLTSYGGHIKYSLAPHSRSAEFDSSAPTVIIQGKYATLFHFHRGRDSSVEIPVEVRLTPENWEKPGRLGFEPASREDIMMALDQIKIILIRADLNNGGVNITNFVMESAQHINIGLGAANLVEECTCPAGYEGLSCQKCSAGYVREMTGAWLGNCVREQCPPGTYGDPATGLACKPCPCPLTTSSNQFARTCAIVSDGRVSCDCNPGYEGRNCEKCAPGYEGNPTIYGDSCRPRVVEQCNGAGTATTRLLGECVCKDNVQGRYCDQCKNNSFFLSNDFRQGCALCFCSGVSQQCMSSNFRRKTTSVNFNIPNIVNEVKIYNSTLAGSSAVAYGAPAETQLKPVLTGAGLTIRGYDRSTPTVLYWSMPLSFAGDMVTAYGGYLRYKMENVQSKFRVKYSTAADVQLISLNHLTFQYSGNFEPLDGRLDATVQFLEKGWHRSDGKEISREHFLLALADVKAILIKATYGDSVATPLSASIEIAEPGGTGPPALHVEQCVCPTGYVGTSCEDCAPGYTRSTSGLYLAHCSLCDCNGHSRQCHPETGECSNCMDNTDGPNCESCKPGYDRDNFDNCVAAELPWIPCQCDPRGSIGPCDASGRCTCKANVEGPNCDRCRAGTFGLEARNPDGCIECFCSGATQECHEGNYYTRIAMAAPIIGEDYGGYTLTDLHADSVIKDELVPAFDKSELIYIFTFPPDQDLYWSLPVFPGNRVTSYGGTLSLRQAFKSNENISSESGIDVVLVGDDLSVYWTNPNTLISEQSLAYQVLLTEQGWYRLGTVVPASRSDFMRILKSLRRVLVRATVSRRLISTSIADVSMDTATDAAQPGAPAALGVEVCTCPAGHLGSSCESCAAGYYKDEQDYCTQCPCSGHDCHLESSGQVTCNCRPPYTGPNCAVIAGEPQATSVRPPPPQSTVSIRILNQGIKIHEIGSSVNFTCQAQSRVQNNPLTISWSKEEGYLPQGRYYVDPYAGVLLITNLQYSDNGVYVCSSTDGISTGSEKVTLLVPANPLKPPTVTIDPSVADYYEGDRVELICIATGDPKPSVYWRRTSNRPLPRSGRQEDSRFIIEDAREEDSGEYSCLAKNTAGSHEGIAVVRVSAQPSRQPRDRLTVSPQAPNVNEGQSMRVVCTGSTSVPAGTIDWVRQDNTRFQSNVRSDNGVLYIDVATRENQGVYICQTQAGDVDPYPVLVTVTPLYIPPVGQQSNISVSANNLNIASGESGTIECKPFGYPLPRITWSKHEGRFGVGVSQRGNTLIVNNAEESDAGYYVCKGFVEGNSKPIGIIYVNVAIERREAPRVQIWPEGFQPATLGSTFEFQCRILAGIPEPDVTWSRTNGRSLSQDTHIKPNNILRFDRVDVNDEGEYICTGNNVMGTSSASAALKVRSLPEIRITPKNVLNVRIGEQLFMECRASGYPQPQITIRGPDRRELAPATVGIATIRVSAASEQDDGEYACVATNEAGTREESFVVRVYRGDAFSDSDGSGEVDVDAGYPETTYPPQIDSNDRDPPSDRLIEYPVPEGENRTVINCPANGFKARWDRSDDKPLQRNAVEEGNNLVIYNISSSDSGEYVCNIYNPQTDVVQVARYIRLRVLPAPRITLRPERQKVNPGMTATVECIVEGDDIRSIQWMPLNRNPSRRIEYRNTMLIFHQIEAEDAGQYQCIAKNSYASASKTAEVIVEDTKAQLITIDPVRSQYITGENVEITCRSSSRDIKWVKYGTNQFVDSKKFGGGAMLVIHSVTIGDAGVYRCTATDLYGKRSFQDFNLEVQPGPSYPSYPSEHEPEREPNQPARYTARLGQLVEMPCHHDLYGPVNINWRRDYTPMQSNVRSDQPILYLNDVSEADAGTYICRVSNNQVALETRAILRVVGVVPKFGGDGWVALPTILDAYRQVDIEVSFKPGDSNGLILYNSERAGRNAGDFLALQLEDGFPQFILETGDGNSIYVTGDRPLTLNTWHTIRLNRIGSQVTMDVDNNGPFKNATADDLILELREPLYVGGVYNLADLPPQLAGASGFVGCVSMLIVRHEEMNLMTNNINRQNVNECDSCAPNPCQNDGVCQEARNERGFTCICLNGYAGERCARRGEGCRPALCGPGRCHDTPSGYKCECPVTHTGRNCENTQSVEYPAFSGSGYLALDPPESKRYFKMSLKVKPTSPVQDGIIMYCAESQRGLGGFTSLAIKNQRLEFRYDLNDGNPMVIVSNITIPARVWTDIQITRSGNVISLTINAVHTYELRQESANKSLNFNTAMFVGGVDEKITVNNNTGVRGGFNGCIKDVEFQNKATDIAKSHNYSGNVQDCNMIDQDERGDVPNENPCLCKNGGTCNADGSCSCPYGTSGYQCENTRQRRGPGPDPCAAHPCRNGGSCKPDYSNMMNHSCDCPLGFSGATCQMDLPLHEMVSFKGDGYLEMPGKLMDYEKDDEPAIMAIAVTTTQNGVLIYQTGLKNERDDFGTTEDEEFVLLRIDRGFVVLEWDMGSGPTSLSVDSKIVTDGERHQVIVRFLSENNVDLTVDDHTVHGTTNGVGNYLNLDSSIYVGGIPSHLNHRELPGLAGCIEQLEFMSMRRALVLGEHAIGGKNTQRCR